MASKTPSNTSSRETISLESISSDLDDSDLLDDMFYGIQFNSNNKRVISIIRKHPELADHKYNNSIERYLGRDFVKTSPLMLCCFYNNYTVAKELLSGKYEIDIEYKNEMNQTPLTMAGEGHDETGNSFKIIKLLIRKGADINHMDIDGDTLFSGICKSFIDSHIEYLLKIPELDINKKKTDKDSPFHILILKFCQIGYHEEYIRIIRKMLNDDRLDIDIRGYNGETVLHILSSYDRQRDHNYSIESLKNLIDLLLIHKVNADITDSDGISPLTNDIVRECYERFIRKKLNQSENRLAISKIAKKFYEEGVFIDEDILIEISKELPFLSDKQINVIDRKILSEELSKKIRSGYQSETLDNMVELYRKLLKNPKLSEKERKQYRKQKRSRKKKLRLPLSRSDEDTLNSEEELERAIKMSVEEFYKGTGSKKKPSKKKPSKKKQQPKKHQKKKQQKKKTKKKP